MTGIIIKNNVEKTHASMLNMLAYYEDVLARTTANSAIEEIFLKLSHDHGYHTDGNWVIRQRQTGGIDSSRVTKIAKDMVDIESHSRYGDSRHIIRSRYRLPLTYNPKSAVSFSDNEIDFGFSGNSIKVDGREYNLNKQLISGGDVVPAISVTTQQDADRAVSKMTDNNHHFIGQGVSPSVHVRDDIPDAKELIDELEKYIDITINSSSPSGSQIYGTSANPQNTKIKPTGGNKEVSFSGTVKVDGMLFIDGNLSTSGGFTVNGILVVKGSAKFSGPVTINGLVLVWQQWSEELEVSISANNVDILGALLISGAGQGTEFDFSTNKGDIKYSKQAIEQAIDMVDVRPVFVQLKWFEQKVF